MNGSPTPRLARPLALILGAVVLCAAGCPTDSNSGDDPNHGPAPSMTDARPQETLPGPPPATPADTFAQRWDGLTTAAPPTPAKKLVATIAPPDAKTALIIGDSHSVGGFGQQLYADLAARKWSVSLFAVCGVTASWWLKGSGNGHCGNRYMSTNGDASPASSGEKWQTRMMAQLNPQNGQPPGLVVIALGANDEDDLLTSGVALLNKVPEASRCVWVAPPPVPAGSCKHYDRGDFTATFQQMKSKAANAAGKNCALIDSARSVGPTGGGCHYPDDKGKVWGDSTAKTILGAQ